MKLGIIGFGRLGKLLTGYLAQDFEVKVHEARPCVPEIEEQGAEAVDFATAASQPIVLPLVPISAFEDVIVRMVPHVLPDAVVIDACSVKIRPVEAMRKHLPETVSILATHPMFGPDSAAETLFGAKLVLCPVRISDARYRPLYLYLEKHGLKLVEATPEQHDAEISRSLFLTHFLGRTLMEMEAGPLDIDTRGYRRLMKILLTVQNDSWQLFEDMYQYNPYAERARTDFLEALRDVEGRLQ